MDRRNPNLRVAPNPEPSETRELIKTVIITSAVSTLVGAFALAGFQATWAAIKRATNKKKEAAEAQPQASRARPSPPPMNDPYYSEYGEEIPESLRRRPDLRPTEAPRRQRAPRTDTSEIRRILDEYDRRQEARLEEQFKSVNRRIDDLIETEDEDEEEVEDVG